MEPSRNKRLFFQVAEALKQKIKSGEYTIGLRLPAEGKLAEGFNVSRPVMREAILALEIQGYVEARVGAGVFVLNANIAEESNNNYDDIGPFELMQARQIIESEATALAAARISLKDLKYIRNLLDQANSLDETQRHQTARIELDNAFHIAIAEASDNSAIAASIKLLWSMRTTNSLWNKLNEHLATTQKDWQATHDDHEEIYRALAQKSPLAAKKAMAKHIRNIRLMLLELTKFDDSSYDNLFFDDDIPINWEDYN